jgi:hypothetical protein
LRAGRDLLFHEFFPERHFERDFLVFPAEEIHELLSCVCG